MRAAINKELDFASNFQTVANFQIVKREKRSSRKTSPTRINVPFPSKFCTSSVKISQLVTFSSTIIQSVANGQAFPFTVLRTDYQYTSAHAILNPYLYSIANSHLKTCLLNDFSYHIQINFGLLKV